MSGSVPLGSRPSSPALNMDRQSVNEEDVKRPHSYASTVAPESQIGGTTPVDATAKRSLSQADLNESCGATVVVAGLPGQNHASDLEKGARQLQTENEELADEKSIPLAHVVPNLVTWDGPDDPTNPRNWPMRRKWIVTWAVSLFALISPISSSMLAPALPNIAAEIGLRPTGTIASMSLSVFVLAYAVGPLFLGPLSELVGRQIVLQCANMFFLIFNVACSQARTPAQIIVLRFLAGLGGSAPLAIGGGVLSDLFAPEQRGLAAAVYSMMPLAGPAVGPVAGGWIAEKVSWRWVFYSTSIADGIFQLFAFICLRETYAPKILGDKAKRLRKETGNDKLHTEYDRPDRTYSHVLIRGLSRPLMFLATEPIVQIISAYQAALYGLMYLTLTTFADLWTLKYHMSVGIGSLNYIPLGLGIYFGAMFGSKVLDRTYRTLKARNGGVGTPEMRIPLMIITSFLIPAGFLMYGWTADKTVHWIVPDIGITISSIGMICAFLSMTTYLIDSFHIYSASAIAAASALRSLAGFGFPLFAGDMFQVLGIGWGNSLCALIAAIFLPAPWLFYYYGPWLRSKSRFARRFEERRRSAVGPL